MLVLEEHYCDFGTRPARGERALREQVDWDRLRAEVGDNPYARAFLYLVDELGITDAPRVVDVDVEPGRATAPTGSDGD